MINSLLDSIQWFSVCIPDNSITINMTSISVIATEPPVKVEALVSRVAQSVLISNYTEYINNGVPNANQWINWFPFIHYY
jgi:hypothetical protein